MEEPIVLATIIGKISSSYYNTICMSSLLRLAFRHGLGSVAAHMQGLETLHTDSWLGLGHSSGDNVFTVAMKTDEVAGKLHK